MNNSTMTRELRQLARGIIAGRRKGLDFMLQNPKEAGEILSPIFKTDAAVRRGLQTLLQSSEPISETQASQWLAQFSPWRALVAAHLWALNREGEPTGI